jgi:hypothetical protein
MQARQKSCCNFFLIPTQLLNLNVSSETQTHMLLPIHIWAPELCTFQVCNGHYTPQMCIGRMPKCVWASPISF